MDAANVVPNDTYIIARVSNLDPGSVRFELCKNEYHRARGSRSNTRADRGAFLGKGS